MQALCFHQNVQRPRRGGCVINAYAENRLNGAAFLRSQPMDRCARACNPTRPQLAIRIQARPAAPEANVRAGADYTRLRFLFRLTSLLETRMLLKYWCSYDAPDNLVR